jgi:uncharacterized protein (DUF433 family)
MTLKELEPQLLALSATEKSQAIQLILNSLLHSWHGIEKTLNVCGGDACIRDTRIPVWLLVSYQKQGLGKVSIFIQQNLTEIRAIAIQTDKSNLGEGATSTPQTIILGRTQ